MRTCCVVVAIALAAGCAHGPKYPATRRDATVDRYFGTEVADPYRWLEDDNAPETAAWVEAQNRLTFSQLAGVPGRERLRARITALWDYARRRAPIREAGKLFFAHNTGLQKQAVLHVQDAPEAAPRVLLDPNLLSEDGSAALSVWSVAPTGRHLAYGVSPGGSDWVEMRVREIDTGKDLEDRVPWIKWSTASWTKDGKGFFYSRYPEPPAGRMIQTAPRYHRVYYHLLGQPVASDRLVHELPDRPDWAITATVTEDGRWLVLGRSDEAVRNTLAIVDLGDPLQPRLDAPPRLVAPEKDAIWWPLGVIENRLYVQTDKDAPRRRIAALDLTRADSTWETVVPESEHSLESAVLAGGRFVAQYLQDARSRLLVFGADGKAQGEIALPGLATVQELTARVDTPELFYSYASFTAPATIVRRDLATGTDTSFFQPKIAFDGTQFETRQEFFTSKDGTRVPLFVTARKGLLDAGPRPTILYGYGGFAISITPWFDASVAAWLEAGGTWAVANLRGGAEYGEAWHQAGMLQKKQNVFDDFIGAAQHLAARRLSGPERLAIIGGSNGGLLVGAAMTQRPELFAAAIPEVGVLDMLRYHKWSAGSYWITEYGSSDTEPEFRTLLAYSPLHNVRPACYPATLTITADHDDRVVPAHSFKFAAALQHAQRCRNPVLVRVETQASHGYRPTDKRIAEAADIYSFAAWRTGLELP